MTLRKNLSEKERKKRGGKKAAVALRLCQRSRRGSSRWKVCLPSTQREIYFVSSCEEVPALALHELGGSWKHRSTYLPTHLPTHLSIHDYLKPLSKCCGLGFEPAILQLSGVAASGKRRNFLGPIFPGKEGLRSGTEG